MTYARAVQASSNLAGEPSARTPCRVGLSRTNSVRRGWIARAITTAAVASAVGLVGCSGGDDPAGSVDQTIVVTMSEYAFTSDVVPVIRAGETVRFVADNAGRLIHEIQVLDADASVLDRTDRVMPGERSEITVRFERPGVHQLICDIDDHLSRGQRALFEVLDADGTSTLTG